jgi:hypothetical protein
VNAEFQWWLLILGMVIGGALVYLVLADLGGDEARDEEDAGPAEGMEPVVLEPSAGDGPDVESDATEGEAAVVDVDETGPPHGRGQGRRSREPLE